MAEERRSGRTRVRWPVGRGTARRAGACFPVGERYLLELESGPGAAWLPHGTEWEELMRYLVLAYGHERDWQALSKREQDQLLTQDQVLRDRGDLVAALAEPVTTVRAWEDGPPLATEGPFGVSPLPLAGFGIVEAADLDEAIRLVADTPCARARGAVELRPIAMMNLPDWSRGPGPSRPSTYDPGEMPSTPEAP